MQRKLRREAEEKAAAEKAAEPQIEGVRAIAAKVVKTQRPVTTGLLLHAACRPEKRGALHDRGGAAVVMTTTATERLLRRQITGLQVASRLAPPARRPRPDHHRLIPRMKMR